MKIILRRAFKRRYEKLRSGEKQRVGERLLIFREDEFHPLLNNHMLGGKYPGYRSINIGGDLRAICKAENDMRIFIIIGTHSSLYKQFQCS